MSSQRGRESKKKKYERERERVGGKSRSRKKLLETEEGRSEERKNASKRE